MTDTEHAYENDAYQSDDIDDNEIIILYLGWKRAGKTTIKERVFDGLVPGQINYVELTTETKVSRVENSFTKIRIVDYPGSRDFQSEINENCYGKPVDLGGLGIGGSHSNLAVIYVIDAQDLHVFQHSVARMVEYAAALVKHNPKVKRSFEIFLHKTDNLQDEEQNSIADELSNVVDTYKAEYGNKLDDFNFSNWHFTSCMDQTIFDATSKVIQKLIPEQAQLENLLNLMINKAMVEKAYLFDVRTKLYIATDSVYSELTMYEICSGMIEMANGIADRTANVCGENLINDEEIPVFDENQETWMTMSNQIVICLYGVTPSLALVCVMREGAQKNRGRTTFNMNLFRKSIRETLARSRSISS